MKRSKNDRKRKGISLMLSILTIVLINALCFEEIRAQAAVNYVPPVTQINAPLRSYNEAYFRVGTLGTSFGLNHFRDLTPRTAVLIGASYSNFRTGAFYSDYYRYLPSSSTNIYGEFRYYLLPKDNQLTAFGYVALNSGYNQYINGRKVNLGLEAGGEVRYKISENASISLRTSIYRQNGGNPYGMSPYGMNPSGMNHGYPMR